jgi:hypothetical protein
MLRHHCKLQTTSRNMPFAFLIAPVYGLITRTPHLQETAMIGKLYHLGE